MEQHVLCTDIAIAWSGQLGFDMFIFFLTLVRSLRFRSEQSRSVSDILLRDGLSFELGFSC